MDKDQRQRLAERYRRLDHDELLSQGREHLDGNVAAQARRAVNLARLAIWTLLLGSIASVAGFILYLLFLAKQVGEDFAELRDATLIEALDLDEDN